MVSTERKALKAIKQQALEYREMGRDFPTFGVGGLIDLALSSEG